MNAKCSVTGCTSWRRNAQCFALPEDPEIKCQWVEFLAECDDQGSEIVICSEHFSEESFETSGDTDRARLKPSAVPKVRIMTDVNEVGDNPRQRACQQIDKRPLSKISSPNQKGEALKKDVACGRSKDDLFSTKTLVVVIKKENIKIESGESFFIQGEAASSNDASSSTSLIPKHEEEEEDETASEESSDESSDESSEEDLPKDLTKVLPKDLPKGPHGDSKQPTRRINKYYRSVKQLCDDCGCFYNPRNPHTCEYKIKPYSCNMCGKRCRTRISLKSHSRIHDNTKTFPCKYCYFPCKSKQDKTTHQESHKDELNPFKCHSCSDTFNCFLLRKKHLGTHKKAREHKCEKCGTAFLKKHVLDRHMLIHSGEKAFKCPICDRGFNQPGNMKSHMRLHTGEKPYKCQYCDQAFNHNVSLKSHMQRYHSSIRPPKTEDDEDLVNHPHTTDEVKQPETNLLRYKYSTGRPKGRPRRNEKSSPQGKRKVNKSLQKRQRKDEQTEEDSNIDWLSEHVQTWSHSESEELL